MLASMESHSLTVFETVLPHVSTCHACSRLASRSAIEE